MPLGCHHRYYTQIRPTVSTVLPLQRSGELVKKVVILEGWGWGRRREATLIVVTIGKNFVLIVRFTEDSDRDLVYFYFFHWEIGI
jgi:hypothetical protein